MSENVLAIAVLSVVPSSTKSVFRILPAGLFRAADGRPGNDKSWLLTPEIGAQLVRDAAQAAHDFPIDYEHQTQQSAKNGQPAPAAGWFKQLDWRPDGLYVTDARWTERAKDMIDRCEYRFLSPVITYDTNTFAVRKLHSIALTNTPALPDLVDLAALTYQGGASAQPPHDAATQADVMRRMGLTSEQFDAARHTAPVDLAPDRSSASLDNLVRQLLPKQ